MVFVNVWLGNGMIYVKVVFFFQIEYYCCLNHRMKNVRSNGKNLLKVTEEFIIVLREWKNVQY